MRSRRALPVARVLAGILALYLVLAYASARVRWISTRTTNPPARLPDAGPLAAGVIHVHTGRSHDAVGSDEEVAVAAHDAGLDFVLVTDHPNAQIAHGGYVGTRFRDGVLLLHGQELQLSADIGRVLVFGLDTVLTRWDSDLDAFGDLVGRSGATTIAAHPRSPRTRDAWKAPRPTGIVAWEVFDLADIGRRRLADPWVLYHALALATSVPFGAVDRSVLALYREGFGQPAVAAFDSLSTRHALTAVGGLDAHPKIRVGGHLVPDYRPFFRTIVNHVVLTSPLPRQDREAADSLAAALGVGRSFISFGETAKARNFRLSVRDSRGERTAFPARPQIIRTEMMIEAGFSGQVRTPLLYRVVRDGRSVGWYRGPGLALPVTSPGGYRVEVYRYALRVGPLVWNLRPWIFSNPVRLRGEDADMAVGLRVTPGRGWLPFRNGFGGARG